MKEYLVEFFKVYAYPEEACCHLEQAYEKINSDERIWLDFMNLLKCYEDDMNYDFQEMLRRMADISSGAGIHEYTGNMLLLICMSKTLKEYYCAASVDESIWFTSMNDLKYKLDECKCVHDIWGTFVPSWFGGFFQMNRFGFGKLQFEEMPFGAKYEKDGIILEPDSTVINVHIPRTGTKLDKESLKQSYQAASVFYQDRILNKPLVFVCHSWLLFPRNKEVLNPASNLYAFISDYDIVKWGEDKDYSEVWRLFDVNYNGNVEQLPQNTSLRRAYADWIRKGEKMGWGYGVYINKD